MYKNFFKRIVDFLMSLLALVCLSPVLLIVSILIRVKLGGPVLFVQQRIGRNCKPFRMYKFRSMSNERDEMGNPLPDEQRLTKFGKILRKTSIDELPALLNILKGEMSFIGPRPLPIQYYPYFTDEELHRHDVRGGLTGIAQINGRNALSWEEKFQYDLTYVRNISFLIDVKIFFQTIVKVVKQSDVITRKSDGRGDLNAQREPVRTELIV